MCIKKVYENATGKKAETYLNDNKEFVIDEDFYHWLEYRSAMCEANSNAVLYDSLPGYDEIDHVANDEANGIDWDSLRYAGIYTDGFIAGALWMKSKIKK